MPFEVVRVPQDQGMLPQSSVRNCGDWRWRGASMDVRGMGGVGGGLRIPGGGLRMTFTKKMLSSARKVLQVAQEGLELPQSAEIDFRAAVVTTMPR